MRVDAEFFKSKEFVWWGIINVFFPFAIYIPIIANLFLFQTQQVVAFSTIALIFLANFSLLILWRKEAIAKYFVVIIVLNVFSSIKIGSLSFSTSLPDWIFLFGALKSVCC
jgi:hypothetical protein